MKIFRVYLLLVFVAVLVYTFKTAQNYTWNLFPVFFSDLVKMNWSGQFNFDFLCFLSFSGLWVSWRNRFSIPGIVLGLIAFVGGTMFLAPYLIYLSVKTKGNIWEVLAPRN